MYSEDKRGAICRRRCGQHDLIQSPFPRLGDPVLRSHKYATPGSAGEGQAIGSIKPIPGEARPEIDQYAVRDDLGIGYDCRDNRSVDYIGCQSERSVPGVSDSLYHYYIGIGRDESLEVLKSDGSVARIYRRIVRQVVVVSGLESRIDSERRTGLERNAVWREPDDGISPHPFHRIIGLGVLPVEEGEVVIHSRVSVDTLMSAIPAPWSHTGPVAIGGTATPLATHPGFVGIRIYGRSAKLGWCIDNTVIEHAGPSRQYPVYFVTHKALLGTESDLCESLRHMSIYGSIVRESTVILQLQMIARAQAIESIVTTGR